MSFDIGNILGLIGGAINPVVGTAGAALGQAFQPEDKEASKTAPEQPPLSGQMDDATISNLIRSLQNGR